MNISEYCFGRMNEAYCELDVQLFKKHYYRPCSRGDNMFGSIRVCASIRLSVGALLFEPFDLIFGMRVDLDLG